MQKALTENRVEGVKISIIWASMPGMCRRRPVRRVFFFHASDTWTRSVVSWEPLVKGNGTVTNLLTWMEGKRISWMERISTLWSARVSER
jgi:hypothetical protein